MAEDEVDQDFTDLQEVEDKIRALTDELEEKMVELDKEYSKKKRPLFDERIKICSKIPNFWLNALLNHRELQEYINTSDYDCLRHLKILDVQDVDQDGMQGTKYSFTFNKNPFFDNQVIYKEFKYNKETGDLSVDTSPIKWKEGCDLTAKGGKGDKTKGKRDAADQDAEVPSFFCWFESEDECESPIGEWIREDIWKDPFKYFCGDDEEDGEDAEEELDEDDEEAEDVGEAGEAGEEEEEGDEGEEEGGEEDE